jgi:putative endonuclease
MREYRFWVYIMASRSRTLYVGVTSSLERRVWEHKNGVFDGFSKTYRCNRLVHRERFQHAGTAFAREKQLKGWSRIKKVALIQEENSGWVDLSADWGKAIEEIPF